MTDIDPAALKAAQALVASANPYLKTALEGVAKEVILAYLTAIAETPRATAEREVIRAVRVWFVNDAALVQFRGKSFMEMAGAIKNLQRIEAATITKEAAHDH